MNYTTIPQTIIRKVHHGKCEFRNRKCFVLVPHMALGTDTVWLVGYGIIYMGRAGETEADKSSRD